MNGTLRADLPLCRGPLPDRCPGGHKLVFLGTEVQPGSWPTTDYHTYHVLIVVVPGLGGRKEGGWPDPTEEQTHT